MEKNKGGRPAGSFKGKEKKIKTGIRIEPRFRRAIIERYASFQEWFDAQVQKEFAGEDLPVLSPEDAKADEAMERADFKLEPPQDPLDISKPAPPPPAISGPPKVISSEQIKQSAEIVKNHSTPIRELSDIEIQSVSLIPENRIVDPACTFEVKPAETLAQAAGLKAPKAILGPPLISQEELDRIKETFQSNMTGPAIKVPILNLDALQSDTNDELDALEGEDKGEDESNLDPFNPL